MYTVTLVASAHGKTRIHRLRREIELPFVPFVGLMLGCLVPPSSENGEYTIGLVAWNIATKTFTAAPTEDDPLYVSNGSNADADRMRDRLISEFGFELSETEGTMS
jgi:hypothetical protein